MSAWEFLRCKTVSDQCNQGGSKIQIDGAGGPRFGAAVGLQSTDRKFDSTNWLNRRISESSDALQPALPSESQSAAHQGCRMHGMICQVTTYSSFRGELVVFSGQRREILSQKGR
jgi:hypothetical protein